MSRSFSADLLGCSSSDGVNALAASTAKKSQLIKQGVDWTQLPDACRLLVVRSMDNYTRAAWRTVCRLACHDVHAATLKITWRGRDPQQTCSTPWLPLPTISCCVSTLPVAIVDRLRNLRHVDCSYLYSLASIQGVPPALRSLDLSFCTHVSSLAPLQHCTALEQLTIRGHVGQQEDLAATLPPAMSAVSPHLRRLSFLSFNIVSDTVAEAVVRALQPLTGLQELSLNLEPLDGTHFPHWQALTQAVSRMTDLRAVTLNNFRPNRGFGPCTNFVLLHVAPAFKQLTQLHSLDLSQAVLLNADTAALTQSLSSMPATLTSLDLSFARIFSAAELVPALRAHSATLRSLSLSSATLNYNAPGGPRGLEALAPGLQSCSALTDLDISSCNITAAGGSALATALSGSAPRLTSLDLSGNFLGDKGAEAVAPELSRMTSLASLCYVGNQLGPSGAACLAPALSSIAPSLTSLDVSLNPLGDEGAAALAPALRSMSALTSLGYRHNELGPAGAASIASALSAVARSLTSPYLCRDGHSAVTCPPQQATPPPPPPLSGCTLSYSGGAGNCDMGVDGVAGLTPPMRSTTAQEHLPCTGTELDHERSTALACAVPCTRLKHLNLADNPIGFEGLKVLAQGLEALGGQQHWEVWAAWGPPTGDTLRRSGDARTVSDITGSLSFARSVVCEPGYCYNAKKEDALKVHGLQVSL